MHTIMLTMEYIGIAMLVLEIIYVMRQKSSYMQTLMLVLLFSLLANFVGYLFELKADNMQTALMGVKFAYLGKPYIILSIFLFVMEFCKVHIPSLLKNALVGFQLIITMLVLTCESHTLYYRSISYTVNGTHPHLVLEHGIFYYLHEAAVFGYFITIIIVAIRRIKHTRDALIKEQIKLFLAMSIVCLLAYGIFLAGWADGYDATLPAYFICVQILIMLMLRYELFNTLSLAKEDATDRMSEAVIVFDNDDDIIYLNRNAELLKQYIEKNYKEEVFQVLKQLDKEKKHLLVHGSIFVGDRSDYQENIHVPLNSVYHISSRKIVKNNRSYGITYVISDETDSYYYTERLEADVREKTHEIVRMQRSIIGSFATMIEARDGITGLHIKNTGNFVRTLVDAMREDVRYKDIITKEYADMVAEAAYLHDIGKISIPDEVLQKPGKLTNEEFDIMKTHPAEGARIIKETLGKMENDEYVKIAYDMAYYHHERYAGGGYPCNLKGNDIPLSARIMAICDVYDALRSKRHYKDGFSVEKATDIIRESKGTHFDPDITEVFLNHIDEIEAVFIQNFTPSDS